MISCLGMSAYEEGELGERAWLIDWMNCLCNEKLIPVQLSFEMMSRLKKF